MPVPLPLESPALLSFVLPEFEPGLEMTPKIALKQIFNKKIKFIVELYFDPVFRTRIE